MPIPLELATLGASSVLGGLIKIASSVLESRRLEHAVTVAALTQKRQLLKDARAFQSRGIGFTRGSIAIIAVCMIIVFPKVIPVFFPEIPIAYGWTPTNRGFWFWSNDYAGLKFEQLHGLLITPLDTHLLSAIIGLYFGGSLTR